MTLDDLEGHYLVAGHIRNATRLTFVRHFAQFQLTWRIDIAELLVCTIRSSHHMRGPS